MAATETDRAASTPDRAALGAEELELRLQEEVSRAERHGSALSCLLIDLQDPAGLAHAHGAQLPEQALGYMSWALGRQLRRFDRVGWLAGGQLLVVLPGADDRRGEIVARRSLGRLHAVKLEHGGERRTIALRAGLAAWREGVSAEQLLRQSRLAACLAEPGTRRSR